MKRAGDKYICLENENTEGVDVITIANRNNDALLLNYEIGDSVISVNVVNKDDGSIVDDYVTEYDDDNFDSKIDTSISTYEAISKSMKKRLKEKATVPYTDEDAEKFRDILANGGSREIYKLSKDELEKMYQFVSDCDDYKSVRALVLWQVQDAIDDFRRSEKDRKKFETSEELIDAPKSDSVLNIEMEEELESALTAASACQLIQVAIDKLEQTSASSDDNNEQVIIDDICAELSEILDEVYDYSEN